jgi:Domain of unknown function (DUF4118)
MDRESRDLMWVPLGGLGAVALAVGLIPLRTITSASNLAFVFIAFTIVVAELGGRRAGLVTAVIAAMGLNFFLTEPYLTLVISKIDDIIAFVGLTACGLIAAAFGSRRERWSAAAGRARKDLDVLKRLVDQLRAGAPLDEALNEMRRALGLGALFLRDPEDRVLAAAPVADTPGLVAETRLAGDTMLPTEGLGPRLGSRGFRVPERGGRLGLRTDRGTFALDLWEGDPAGLDRDEWRTLSIAASVLALELSRPSTKLAS